MRRNWWMSITLCAAGASAGCTNIDETSSEQQAAVVPPDLVLNWNRAAEHGLVTVLRSPPGKDYYWTAIMQVAMYDALNAIGGHGGRYTPLLATPSNHSPASREAAVSAAAYTVMSTLVPQDQATFDAQYQSDLAAIPNGAKKDNGIALGIETAQQVLAATNNGVIPDGTYTLLPPGPGVWEPLPPAFAIVSPGFGLVTPFTMTSPDQFRAGYPPALDSATYTADYNETRLYGGSGDYPTLATQEQKNIGRVYGIEGPHAQYHRITRRIVTDYSMSLDQAARFMAMTYVAFTDSQIACWDTKFYYSFWRPYTAIRRGDTDGNDNTPPDYNWVPLTPTPGHPEYPAAHGCFTGAFAEVLRAYFGTDRVHVVIDSAPTDLSYTFEDVDDLKDHITLGRIYGGMHFRNSMVVGLDMGEAVVAQLAANYFQRLPE